MSEPEFDKLADRTLTAVLESISATEDENLDAEVESGVLTITFSDGQRFVVNSHRAARQIWVAALSSAWHFTWDGLAWRSTKSDDELFELLEDRLSAKLGQPFSLAR